MVFILPYLQIIFNIRNIFYYMFFFWREAKIFIYNEFASLHDTLHSLRNCYYIHPQLLIFFPTEKIKASKDNNEEEDFSSSRAF